MKKILCVILSILMMCPLMTACGDQKQPENSLIIWRAVGRSYMLDSVIKAYKEKYPDVNLIIENVEVSNNEDFFEGFAKKLGTALMSGNGPDIIELTSLEQNYDITKMMKSGVFADMTGFYDTDSEFNKSDLFQGVMDCGVYDGKRYVFPHSFMMPLALTSTSMIEKTGFDKSKCTDFSKFIDEVYPIIEKSKADKTAPVAFDTWYALRLVVHAAGADMINYKNESVSVDTSEFKKAMEFYKKIYAVTKNSKTDIYNFMEPDFTRAVFTDFSFESFTSFISAAKNIQSRGENPVIVPVRSNDGKLRVKLDTCFGVSSNSKNKQNAWNFIKLSLSEEIMSAWEACLGTPISRAAFQDKLTQNGVEVLPQAFIDEYMALNNEISTGFFFSSNMIKVDTIMMKYWNDEKSLDDCIKEAQDQLEIYISE
ncbi:MAG: extracellular solute-binding protein [Oscillospiraceae bacterium]